MKKKSMSREQAIMVVYGELRKKSHKECAAILGLTYDAVYAARYGDTFKRVLRTQGNTSKFFMKNKDM